MRSSASVFALNSAFDNFLFATIGEDEKGMMLSVLSALARLNVDPWQEAAALMDLSKEDATRRLAMLIQNLPVESAKLDDWTIAARLIALLPPRRSAAAVGGGHVQTGAMNDHRIAILVFFIVSMLVGLFVSVNHQSPSHAHQALSAVSHTSSSKPTGPVGAMSAAAARKAK